MRLIKKYPNRRLYCTGISSYITLEDVRQLILDGVAFQVCDARTGEDLTRQVLLQVIAEHEQGDEALLTPPLLMRLVRLYGDPRQVEIAPCLEQALDRLGVPPAPSGAGEPVPAMATARAGTPRPPAPAPGAGNLTGTFGQLPPRRRGR